MKFQIKSHNEITSDTIICFKYEDIKITNDLGKYLDNLSQGQLTKQTESEIFKGRYLETLKIALTDKLKAVIVGLGKECDLTRKKISIAAATGARCAKNITNKDSIAIEIIDSINNIKEEDIVQIMLSASSIGLYEFDKYKSKKSKKNEQIELIVDYKTPEIEKNLHIAESISNAMNLTKNLVNEQAQIATPEYISEVAKEIAQKNNLEVKVYSKDEIKEMGMNAFLAVGQGSINEPKLVHLTYKPQGTIDKKIALIGKGITFDAGGMNIKPATSMLNMKDDMTGAASVISIIQAISQIKPNIELHVICALCENMTSGSAYKQGDVLTAMNGKTIEVDNTDAEGRITLADALSYADTLEVDEVIDIATLTGAVIVALGNNITAVLGNNQNQIDKFLATAENYCENVWQMPILDELKDNLKSEIADFKNTGGRNAGTSCAAWFLSNFTKSNNWMHLDIAGTAYLDKSNKETLFGPTGVMIRSLVNYLIS